MTEDSIKTQDRARTVADLARIAGVSAGTVSRALSGSSLVREETRKRIAELAREHDFTPNIMARNLRTQRTGAIGVIFPLGHATGQHISDPFFITLLGYLADALTERGYDLLLSRIIPSQRDWLSALVDSGRVDGAIVVGQSDQVDLLEEVASRYHPLVVWGGYKPSQIQCSVGTDNQRGGEIAAEHLLAQGCRSIAFFGDPVALEIRQRLDGCKTGLQAAGYAQTLDVLPVELEPEGAYHVITHWLDTHTALPDGIFAASDVIAMTTIRALVERGLKVPQDIKVIGYDDLPLAAQTSPPLTTVKQDMATGAVHLVDLLFRRIAGEDTQSVILPPSLVVRASA